MTTVEADAQVALRAAAAVGGFFTVDPAPVGRGWYPLRDLVRSPTTLDRRIALIRRNLARPAAVVPTSIPLRTAASVDLMGLAARVLSPVLGAAALTGVTPGLTLDSTWFRHGPGRLAVSRASARATPTSQQAAEAVVAGVVQSVLAPLIDTYAQQYRVSRTVLWGDLASALNGTAVVLRAAGLPQAVPVDELVAAVLRLPSLSPTVRSMHPQFVRNTCCLYYKIPGAGLCGDCVLRAR